MTDDAENALKEVEWADAQLALRRPVDVPRLLAAARVLGGGADADDLRSEVEALRGVVSALRGRVDDLERQNDDLRERLVATGGYQ